eukprot:scaffold26514_cov53-Phaeocystis_antarctica.AAC.1
MSYMFYVRPCPCPASNLQSSPLLHAACTAAGRHLRPPGLHLTPHRMPFFRLSAGRGRVQPAAELRHVQRHGHELHVRRALTSSCPAANLQSSPLLHAACTAVARHLRPPGLHLAPHRMPFF